MGRFDRWIRALHLERDEFWVLFSVITGIFWAYFAVLLPREIEPERPAAVERVAGLRDRPGGVTFVVPRGP